MSFTPTDDVKIQSKTQQEITLPKVITRKLSMNLLAGDSLVITVKGNDVFNGNIPANKEVNIIMTALIKDV